MDSLYSLSNSLKGLGDSIQAVTNSLQNLAKQFEKEYKAMELKLILYKARAAALENRGPHNTAIVAHLRRRIKNLEAKIGQKA